MKWRSLEESTPGADVRSLREKLAGRKELIAKYVPAEIQAVHERVIADLAAGGILNHALGEGAKAPGFDLPDQNGKQTSLASLLEHTKVVVFFLRGRWCPFCVGQLEAMNQALPQVRGAGASIVAISPQTVQQAFFMADQHRVQFPLLSDAGNRVARAFGLAYQVPDEQQAIFRRAFINLPFTNGDESWELPIPATFVIDRDATILYASSNPDYTQRPEPEDIVEALRKAGPSARQG